MIIEFKIANFRSIHEEQAFSFVAENSRRHSNNLIARKGYKLLKAAALFGANASGKSNVIKALSVMQNFVRNSATRMNDGDPISGIDPFRLDPESRTQPSRFEITFLTDDKIYTYGFAADSQIVHGEWLRVKAENTDKETFFFERSLTTEKGIYSALSDDQDGLMYELLLKYTRDNALALSTGAQNNVEELLPAYRYIRNSIWVYDMSGPSSRPFSETSRLLEEDEQIHKQVTALLQDADTGIESIDVEYFRTAYPPFESMNLPKSAEEAYRAGATLAYRTTQEVITSRRDKDGKPISFNFKRDESDGTQRLFALAGPLLEALKNSDFLVIDELDASMHPLLTRKLLELFQSPNANPNGAQLMFTTHDSSLLSQDLFRRDQIWLAEKRSGASVFYSLADVKPLPRNTESFLRNYLSGRYGGTPYLGGAFQSLELDAAK